MYVCICLYVRTIAHTHAYESQSVRPYLVAPGGGDVEIAVEDRQLLVMVVGLCVCCYVLDDVRWMGTWVGGWIHKPHQPAIHTNPCTHVHTHTCIDNPPPPTHAQTQPPPPPHTHTHTSPFLLPTPHTHTHTPPTPTHKIIHTHTPERAGAKCDASPALVTPVRLSLCCSCVFLKKIESFHGVWCGVSARVYVMYMNGSESS
jgi:hypothetical protein